MIKIFKDIYNFIRFKKNEKIYKIGFFSENNFIYQYLEPYIVRRNKKTNIFVISFEDLNRDYLNERNVYVFKSKFFQELVFLTLNIKYLYSSTPDLNSTIFKKSKFSNCKYIYISHSPVSLTLIYREDAFNNFDAIQVTNSYQYEEMKQIKEKNMLKTKIFKSKYLFLEKAKKNYRPKNIERDLIIAPSWNSNFYKNKCHIILNELLKEKKISFKIRPHPMSFKKGEISRDELLKDKIILDDNKKIEFDRYNFLISDWSGIFIEYFLISGKRAFMINTPKKMLNKNFKQFKAEPIEIHLRNVIGKTYEISEINKLVDEIYILKQSGEKNIETNLEKKLDKIFY